MCLRLHIGARTHTDRKAHTHLGLCERLPTILFSHFYYYQSRLEFVCVYATHVLLFFYHLFRLNLLYKKNYVNTRRAHSTNHSCCHLFFRSFVWSFRCLSVQFLRRYFIWKNSFIWHVHFDSSYNRFYLLLSSELETGGQLHASSLRNRNITYVFVVMGKLVCVFGREKIYVFIWQSCSSRFDDENRSQRHCFWLFCQY